MNNTILFWTIVGLSAYVIVGVSCLVASALLDVLADAVRWLYARGKPCRD